MSTPPSSVLLSFRRIGIRLARPDILFWTLPLMMILLILGTVAQKDQGLFIVHQTYFSSFLIWFGPVPFPGGASLMAVFFCNLLAKFLLFSEWEWRKCGVIVTHFGVLLLLVGGGFTALTQKESYMVIEEGKASSVSEDYHQRELQILKGGQIVYSMPHQNLESGLNISNASLPFNLIIDIYCYHCGIQSRATDEKGWTSPGRFMQLIKAETQTNDEENMTGIEFRIEGIGLSENKFVTFDKFPKPPKVSVKGETYTIRIGREQEELPFSIRLDKFTRTLHPGTDIANAYQSDVTLQLGSDIWPASLSMNNPLRLQGYTIYQSSFDLSGDKPFTVLHVVRNQGRLFPYVSSIIMMIGLLVHLLIQMRTRV